MSFLAQTAKCKAKIVQYAVFNVKHIKGLEFEAVFFIGIDRLAEIQPNLYDKYLYVGTTRAATYLGITCEQEFPSSMAELQELFQENGWR